MKKRSARRVKKRRIDKKVAARQNDGAVGKEWRKEKERSAKYRQRGIKKKVRLSAYEGVHGMGALHCSGTNVTHTLHAT